MNKTTISQRFTPGTVIGDHPTLHRSNTPAINKVFSPCPRENPGLNLMEFALPNLFNHLPPTGSDHEVFNELLSSPSVRIERIVSTGQSSPSGFWYDQSEIEWIALLQGRARLAVEESEGVTLVELGPGDYYLLPAHCRHRVEWTDPEQPTIWLAIFFPATAPNQPEGTI